MSDLATAPSDALAIRRQIDLDAELDEVWALISSPDGWSSWMVDGAEFTGTPSATRDTAGTPDADEYGFEPGETGTVIDDGRRRHVLIDEIVESSRVTFTWWSDDEGDAPSQVTISIGRGDDDRRRLQIVERPIQVAPQARVALPAGLRWDVRMTRAAICLSAFPVRV